MERLSSVFSSVIAQLRSGWKLILLVFLLSALPIGVVVLLNMWRDVPYSTLTRDPTTATGAPIYTGFLSQVSILLWASATAICLLSAKVTSSLPDNPTFPRFFFASAALTLMLGLDDAFLLHEVVFPYLGVSENIVYASYIGLTLVYLVIFRKNILKTKYILFFMSFLFFGLSMGLDVITPRGVDFFLLEDGAKLVGIMSWLTYFYDSTTSVIGQHNSQHMTKQRARKN
jgi:hypothetical protein